MTDREKVIRGLECCVEGKEGCRPCPYSDHDMIEESPDFCQVVMLEDALKLLREQEPSGWISVKDRLPERGNTCLVWLRGGGMTFMVFDGSRFIGGSAYSDDRITHWMLLPGAPEEVST